MARTTIDDLKHRRLAGMTGGVGSTLTTLQKVAAARNLKIAVELSRMG
jgi:hypothetical protein